MKLANIFLKKNGIVQGQAPAGTSDANCINVVAKDSQGITRDIKSIVMSDNTASPIYITRRLVGSIEPAYKYVIGPATSDGSKFCTYYTGTDEIGWQVSFQFMLLSDQNTTLIKNYYTDAKGYDVKYTTDGKIIYTAKYPGTSATQQITTWDNINLTPNVWYSINIYGNGDVAGGTVTLTIDGVSKGTQNNSFANGEGGGNTIYIGDSNTYLRGNVVIKGTTEDAYYTINTLNVNIENSTVGNNLSLTNNGITLSGGEVIQATINTQEWVE